MAYRSALEFLVAVYDELADVINCPQASSHGSRVLQVHLLIC